MKNQMLSLDQIQIHLKDKRLYKIAKETGLSYPTLKKMADGKDANYTMNTILPISKYISENHQLLERHSDNSFVGSK